MKLSKEQAIIESMLFAKIVKKKLWNTPKMFHVKHFNSTIVSKIVKNLFLSRYCISMVLYWNHDKLEMIQNKIISNCSE